MPDDQKPTKPQALSRLRVPPPSEWTDEVRATVAGHHGDGWTRVLALNPATLKRFTRYFGDLFDGGKGHLPLRERELIAVVVSAENGCGLCEQHHAVALGAALGDSVKARRVALDWHLAPLTDREAALAAFAVKVTATPKAVGAEDFQRLRAVGLGEEAILEALEIATWFNHTNRIFISLGVPPDSHLFDQ